ncbi:MAG: XRE family transcriptional regulator [Pseudomonadota bacterium]
MDHTDTEPTDDPAAEVALELLVGAQVRALRQALGMTLAELAQSAGISTGMLSKIENGQTSPSLSTLQSLAAALNMPLGSFFATFDQKRDATFVRAGEGLTIDRRGSAKGHRYQLLGHGVRSAVQVEPFLITLDESSDAFPIFRHEGTEFIYMLKGEITYAHGDRTYTLTPGDSFFFDAGATHGPLELRQLPAVYLSIIVTPPD